MVKWFLCAFVSYEEDIKPEIKFMKIDIQAGTMFKYIWLDLKKHVWIIDEFYIWVPV